MRKNIYTVIRLKHHPLDGVTPGGRLPTPSDATGTTEEKTNKDKIQHMA